MAQKKQKETTKKSATPSKKTVKKKAAKKKAAKKPASKATISKKTKYISPDEKLSMIAINAYFKWENSGFTHGDDYQHWIEAEREILDMLE